MATFPYDNDESFLILGSSPGTSLDLRLSEMDIAKMAMDNERMDETTKYQPADADTEFKAYFKLGDSSPSPVSMIATSTIFKDDRSTEKLQKRFVELLDENVILKDTLKQNNKSIKEHFSLIASCQEDMMKTHMLHKEKFEETKALVGKLRQENKKLRQDVSRLSECGSLSHSSVESDKKEKSKNKSGPSSAVEFVTSPDDDTMDKLTAQLALVEKQRRQVIVENEKLSWQKESLEHIVDVTSKERDDLKEKMEIAQLQLSMKDAEHATVINKFKRAIHDLQTQVHTNNTISISVEESNKPEAVLYQLKGRIADLQADLKTAQLQILDLENVKLEYTRHKCGTSEAVEIYRHQIQELQNRLKEASNTTSISTEELTKRETVINVLEGKIADLLTELKMAQLKILDLENVRLEFTRHKSGTSEAVKIYRDQIQELQNRLKEATTTLFQPVRLSISPEPESSSEYTSFMSNVKLYDRTMKHLADLLNLLIHGTSDSLFQSMGLISILHNYKLEKTSVDQFMSGLTTIKEQMEKLHSTALNNIGQVRNTTTIFEGIFHDYNELLKKSVTQPESPNVEALTAALVARGQDLQVMQAELNNLREQKENTEVMKTQLDLFRSDFEAERKCREKMASEKEAILTDIRKLQKLNDTLSKQLEEVRKMNPSIYQTAVSRCSVSPTTIATSPVGPTIFNNTSKRLFTCPKCMRFSCEQYKVMEDHLDYCLEDF